MKVSQQTVGIIFSEEGQAVLRLAVPGLPDSPVARFYAQDTDDIGLWVRIPSEDGEHFLLIRWEYVLSIDFPVGETKTVGFERVGS